MAERGAAPALVSVHDVMPSTLDRVEALVAVVRSRRPGPVTLLVVPGAGWGDGEIARLRRLVAVGCELAGHGWVHRAERVAGIRHRLHSALISRGVAEHLALDRPRARALLRDCHAWFGDRGLPPPALYVPPAWALGPLDARRDADLPFAMWEDLGGVHDLRAGRRLRLPLAGYEADDRLRAAMLRLGNLGAFRLASERRPLRLAIHPADLSLRLSGDLRRALNRIGPLLSYAEIVPLRDAAPGATTSRSRAA